MKLKYNAQMHAYWLDGKRCKGASTIAKLPDDDSALVAWKLRTALIGVAHRPDLLTSIAADHDDKDRMRELVDKAIEAGKGTTGRDYGTAVHRVIERINSGEMPLETPEVTKLRQQWQQLLTDHQLEVVSVEGAVVHPGLKVAGRYDVKVRNLTTGRVHIGDVKTGADADKYLRPHAVQLHLYASAPYVARGIPVGDVDFETTEFDEQTDVDQEIGYVFHLPLDGEPQVIGVDLTAGAWCMEHVITPTWTWRSRNDLRVPTTVAADADVREASASRDAGATSAATPSDPLDSFGSFGSTTDIPAPDEGATVDPATIDALKRRYLALPDTVRKGVLRALADDATTGRNGRGRVPYSVSELPSVRRFEITRGLIALCEHDSCSDDVLRAIVHTIAGDTAWFATLSTGQVVGMLNADEAAVFASRCEQFVALPIPARINDDGRMVLEFAA